MPTLRTSPRRQIGFSILSTIWLLAFGSLGAWLLLGGGASEKTPKPLTATSVAAPLMDASLPQYKKIEDIRVGDYVLAKDPNDLRPPTPHKVIALPRNWTEHVVHIIARGGGELRSTRSHPFWVVNHGWTDAKDLQPADWLIDEHNWTIRIERTWTEVRNSATFNLTVSGVHTYYTHIGTFNVLVHNVDPWQFGDYDQLKADSIGDDLHIHHYPQGQPASEVIPGYNYQKGLAVAVPSDEHMSMNGTNYKAREFSGDASGLIDEAKSNMQSKTSIPSDKLEALDAEARGRYLPPCK